MKALQQQKFDIWLADSETEMIAQVEEVLRVCQQVIGVQVLGVRFAGRYKNYFGFAPAAFVARLESQRAHMGKGVWINEYPPEIRTKLEASG